MLNNLKQLLHKVSQPGIFIYSILQHLTWGITLLFSTESIHTTSINMLYFTGIKHQIVGAFLLIVSLAAFYELFYNGFPKWKQPVFLFVQQFILVLSAFGAGSAIYKGHFADLVVRSRSFLLDDQIPHILIALLHTLNLLYFRKGHGNK